LHIVEAVYLLSDLMIINHKGIIYFDDRQKEGMSCVYFGEKGKRKLKTRGKQLKEAEAVIEATSETERFSSR
jgi:hypothetical protein